MPSSLGNKHYQSFPPELRAVGSVAFSMISRAYLRYELRTQNVTGKLLEARHILMSRHISFDRKVEESHVQMIR